MKKLLIVLSLILFSLPSYASFGYVEGHKYNAQVYDDNGTQAYAQKLEKEYWDRVHKGECEINGENYAKYVKFPLYKYIEQHPIDYNKTVD